ncbi:MAG: hypothetical protein QXL17_02870 [Candidatus Thermoplasmatota archaeon]
MKHITRVLVAIAFTLPLSSAFANECSPVVNALSYHFDRKTDYNEHNFGVGIECSIDQTASWQVGFYHNSEYTRSEYVFFLANDLARVGSIKLGLTGGLVHGYDYATILPVAAGVVQIGVVRVLVLPPIVIDGKNIGVIGTQIVLPFSL